MKPYLTPSQGRLIRALGIYLSKVGKQSVRDGSFPTDLTIESIESTPWSSLTFGGERHRLVVHLRGWPAATAIDGNELVMPGALVAVERVERRATRDGTWLTLELLVIAA